MGFIGERPSIMDIRVPLFLLDFHLSFLNNFPALLNFYQKVQQLMDNPSSTNPAEDYHFVKYRSL